MRRTAFALLVLTLIIVGCSGEPEQIEEAAQVLPTRVPTNTPTFFTVDNAEAVVRSFLVAWEQRDYASMYALISPSSQQAIRFDEFVETYDTNHAIMQLEGQTFELTAVGFEGSRVARVVYNMTFETGLVGEFSDEAREMELVLDIPTESWRVAWSPATIFTELGSGSELRLETFPPRRANIYDRSGNILADMNGRIVTLELIRSEIPNEALCLNLLTEVLNLTPEEVQERLDNNAPDWLAEIGLIEPETYLNYEDALVRDCNAQFGNRSTRRYIYGDLFAHILGTVGYPDEDEVPIVEEAGFRADSIIGRSGIEQSWDEVLRGTPGARLSLVRADGTPLRVLAEVGPQPAQEVQLTIDLDLQRAALEEIAKSYNNNIEGWGSSSPGASAIVLDVRTGELLALVSFPTFNNNAFTPFPVMGREQGQAMVRQVEDDPRQPQLNRVVQGRYPSGSTMKTFTAIAALDSGEYDFTERYFSTGVWNRDIPRTDWLGGGHGSLNLAQALTHSCNSCFYEAGFRLNGIDPYLLPEYANSVGFGVPTGMTDLPTTTGFIGTPDTKNLFHPEPWTFSDAVDMSIGQGMVEISPLQMAVAYSMVANDGVHFQPQLVWRTGLLDLGEISYEMEPVVLEELDIDEEILPYLRDGLCDVTTESYGTAEYIFRRSPLQESVGVCGKTGTAETPSGLSHAWFAGWAPREFPEIMVVVLVENAGEGSAVAAPIVRNIMEYYFFGAVSSG